jgi:hypothetical protein
MNQRRNISIARSRRRSPLVSPIAERWMPCVGWEALYQVSDQHRVRSLDRLVIDKSGRARHHRGRVLVPSRSRQDDPPQVTLSGGGRRKCCYVHKLVCEAFGKQKG